MSRDIRARELTKIRESSNALTLYYSERKNDKIEEKN